ncbi:MAG: hypothetical protein QM756_18695 [Polyangiaceae bacterium]
MHHRNLLGSLLALGLLFGVGSARADDTPRAGTFALGVERLFGFVHTSESSDRENVQQTNSNTTVSLLGSGLSRTSVVYSFPRLAFDYFPIDHLSVGGSIAYFHVSGSQTLEAGGVSQETDQGTTSGFIFAPRAGYAFMFSGMLGLWPRAGLTYLTASTSGAADVGWSGNRFAFTLEAPLVIAPVPHVAFLVGPTLDLGVTGSSEVRIGNTTTSVDTTATEFGVQAAISTYF